MEKFLKLLKNKKAIILTITIILLILSLLIIKLINIDYKKQNNGNNNHSKTLESIEDYIFSIKSYELTAEITINSNKNINKYLIKQTHTSENIEKQVILEPSNLAGIEITYQNDKLEIKNTSLNLSKIYSDYQYIEDNNLWLNSFIKDYERTTTSNKKIEENDSEIVITVHLENKQYKKLYIDKETQKPVKLIIQDNSKKDIISILYNEININY